MDETEKLTIKNGQLLRIYSWFFNILNPMYSERENKMGFIRFVGGLAAYASIGLQQQGTY